MSITITFPATMGDVTRAVSALAEPCLVAAAALVGAGPLAQVLLAGAVRLTRGVDVEMRDGEMHISFD
ncbi:hypothetical protein KGQ20_33720 [Catenulispora sp. NF23]|uniref:Uncharacterized protein n=1 Tax=Catenulispora pinistramenti TaxID=2705254 RepID=A0ABS5KYJ5_9ACTN|nr:hypothetical protein [Catenulispora pinistramenti]MBS2537723.1 hypothetical protein [Catenulispora pinistramenti]MBS2551039.1 hypothetical protein [Catenulispora pinistramenti]